VGEDQAEALFQRIWSLFGSPKIYEVCPDIKPFLTWAKRRGIVTGIISNSDERYADGVLPMLQLTEQIDFFVFSKKEGVEKPDPLIFEAAFRRAQVA